MKLTGKQKRFLRASANRMRPIFEVGKNGLSSVWLDEIQKALDTRELIKINVLQNSAATVDDIKDYIESKSDVTVVQTIGKTLVLFKPSKDTNNQKLSNEVFAI
ncbi:ribosome assembly RNA-binding protein YhbY [Lentilactobacillus kefiri]|uniref:RNA-binding, CRM domain-containing protein n=2 Tax=Lentilactobacillus kefiri TaxID=33962 RepID=A0A8E1V305_LENKE|nr:ribosome assembly RNA-binding protein YhbY [Lentilactobacillus kefiri]KRL58749.1 RNA-binding, CRM domain-containing protein [Lentilactobacillus parakefiri DSM 10551]KRM53804.1 RNA-binding, CRM domain-containing protein [Lentilactobacillus kefiri DSM 20587 = JCM 5818]MCJ2161043.1 ribosome assembly RNA-binding protein YhbY [Lentilactobacillus kefiri]MCP9368924.1 ribosome assembly RNA-binding protein YhbY [Lentilactobacillus kefiri]MDH5108190.1 ribosome assembly RNA-binding protein YhbY [Lenti